MSERTDYTVPTESCATCGGTGKWFVWDRNRQEMKVLRECSNCSGTGVVPNQPVSILTATENG